MSQELENRFFLYASNVRDFCRKVKWDIMNLQYIKQVIRSSSSVAANYIESSDDIGKADEKMKIKISRRETRESVYWLKLILVYNNKQLEAERNTLIEEGNQIRKILSVIVLRLS